MKALLVYSYSSKNAGDMAITLGAIDLLTSKYNSIKMVSRYSEFDQNFKESKIEILKRNPNIQIIGSPFELDRNKGNLGILKNYLNGIGKLLFGNSFFNKVISDVDIVFFNGGNLLRCNSFSDFARLIALVTPLMVAKKLKKPVIILPHSTAETNLIGRIILKRVLNRSQKIYVREPKSLEKFQSIYPKANFILTTDLAFSINEKVRSKREKIVAITTRSQTMGDLASLDKERKTFILDKIEECIVFCLQNGFKVLLVSQTKKDISFTRLLANKFLDSDVEHIINLNTIQLIKTYSRCSLIIGMRLHSIILALWSGTPAIGFFSKEWGLKNPGLMEAYNQKYCFVEDPNLNLLNLIKEHDFNQTNEIEKHILKTKKLLNNELKSI